MNRTQRCVLFIFTIIILLSSSYSSDLVDLKYFLGATLLFFVFSPKIWFRSKHIQLDRGNAETETPELGIVTKRTPAASHSLPSIGFPNSEKLLILKTLFKIRCAEIGNIYVAFRSFQKKYIEDEWIPIFMEKYAYRDTYRDFDPWVDIDMRAIDQASEENAKKICKKRGYNRFFGPEKIHESKVADIKAALFFCSFGSEKMIQYLSEIKTFGFIENTILELIREYKILEEVTEKGSFDSIFREDKSEPKIKESLNNLTVFWAGISRVLKMSISLEEIQNGISNDSDFIREIDALCELERHIDWAISEYLDVPVKCNGCPDKEQELFFMECLKSNPFREELNPHFYAIFTH